MHTIVSLKVVEDYKIAVTFDTKESFIYDVEPNFWGEVFEPLKDPKTFSPGSESMNSGHLLA